jgi:hypothetical protein
VEGKTDLDRVSVEVARLQGLSPCRVCNPPGAGPDGKKPARKRTAAGTKGSAAPESPAASSEPATPSE